jgi:uncharacterized phage-associated protein
MRSKFREDKATQAAARILRHAGGRMEYLKLIKLLYLCERESLVRLGSPLTYDACWSLPYGPILSATLDRVNQQQLYRGGYWDLHIAPKDRYQVSLRAADVPNDQLSAAEEELIDRVLAEYGHLPQWELVELTHKLPEWENPNGSALSIDPAVILRSEGYTEEEIEAVMGDWAEAALAQSLAG